MWFEIRNLRVKYMSTDFIGASCRENSCGHFKSKNYLAVKYFFKKNGLKSGFLPATSRLLHWQIFSNKSYFESTAVCGRSLPMFNNIVSSKHANFFR